MGFTCPNAKCSDNYCDCGSECVNFGGTCCKNVEYDFRTREYVCVELSKVVTYDVDGGGTIYNPEIITPEPIISTQKPSNCNIDDKYYKGVVVEGSDICKWAGIQ